MAKRTKETAENFTLLKGQIVKLFLQYFKIDLVQYDLLHIHTSILDLNNRLAVIIIPFIKGQKAEISLHTQLFKFPL